MDVQCSQRWTLGDPLGSGGFGRVFQATGEDGTEAAVKLVPREPGADRELLFANPQGARNVMPVLDTGETDTDWVMVMPLADRSLADAMARRAPTDLAFAIEVMRDITTALVDLGKLGVVHRDLKPANVLAYDERWVLSDFGISRFAESATSTDTHKYSSTPPYTAPERWRAERATSAADVYSLGVMAYEMVSGGRPFVGPGAADYRQQHLHDSPPVLQGVPPRLSALIDECLDKSPQARPAPPNILRRLEKAAQAASAPGAASLAQAYQASARQAAEESRRASEAMTEVERRKSLLRSATRNFVTIQKEFRETLLENAPGLPINEQRLGGWNVALSGARLVVSGVSESSMGWGGWQPPAFDVIAHASIVLEVPATRSGYTGREHSLWYGDIRETGVYAWFETAFMDMPLMRRQTNPRAPFSLPPGEASAQALWNGMAPYQLAWPFAQLEIGDLDTFFDRWLAWFAAAAQGVMQHPMQLPEGNPHGSWRMS